MGTGTTAAVYAITDVRTQQRYVGRTVDCHRRWVEHQSQLRRGTHSAKELQAAWNASRQDIEFSVLEELTGTDKMHHAARERWWMDQFENKFNVSTSSLHGGRPGFRHSLESRLKISLALTGLKRTEAQRAAISAARKGTKNPAHGDKVRGRKRSEETRAKMRASHAHRPPVTDETRAKQSAALKGRVFTPEWRARISHAKRGKPWSVKARESRDSKGP